GRTTVGLYRPFHAQNVDHSDGLVYLPAVARRYFPTAQHDNLGFYLTGVSSHHEFSLLGTQRVPDLHLLDTGQFFPRYRWEPLEDGGLDLDLSGDVVDGYRRVDNITDEILTFMRTRYGADVTKDDIFFFVYGLLHSPESPTSPRTRSRPSPRPVESCSISTPTTIRRSGTRSRSSAASSPRSVARRTTTASRRCASPQGRRPPTHPIHS